MQYRPAAQELYIAFRSRQEIYRYFDVSIEEWRQFLEAGSKGTYLNQAFKPREHPYETVDAPIPPPPQTDSHEPLEWGETWALRKKSVRAVQLERRTGKVTA
jgi:hypothetical protein